MGVACHPKREILTPEEVLLTAPTCQALKGKRQAPGKSHSTPGRVPTEARVRQRPSTQLPILTVPETLAGLWLLCAYQQAGASQPFYSLPTMSGKAPWHQH